MDASPVEDQAREPGERITRADGSPIMPDALLEINDLRISFRAEPESVEAVSGIAMTIGQGEVVAIVGESGSGKTVTALSIGGLLPTNAVDKVEGSIRLDGEEILSRSNKEMRDIRGARIAYVFQEPGSALNPVFTVKYQLLEALRIHGRKDNSEGRIRELLTDVGIDDPERVAASYPHQLSGGQQQRIMIAMALACEPELLIADEPTTALDVTVQAQILDLLKSLQNKRNMAVILITHNLAIAAGIAQRMYVMYAGKIVETGNSGDVINNPRHPYTKALLKAVPRLRGEKTKLESINSSAWKEAL